MRAKTGWRLLLLGFTAGALLAGMWAGLLRMGWRWPVLHPNLPVSHGPLMVSGFFGALIILERAVALGRKWPYVGVVLCGLGGLWVVVDRRGLVGPLLLTLGSLWLVLIFGFIMHRHRALHTAAMTAGAACWAAGSVLWLAGRPVYQVVLWWAAFLVLTIAGERLELSRVLRLTRFARRAFMAACGLLLVGLLAMLVHEAIGFRIAGLGLLAQAAWLARFDIARYTVRKQGLTRYIAACLLAGYFWLAASGSMALIYGVQYAGLIYDAILHAVFVGFIFSMVFGHAPIIFPAILGQQIAYSPAFYLPLGLLHLSLLLRVGGDLLAVVQARQWGGLLNATAVLVFAGMMVYAYRRAARKDAPGSEGLR